MSLHMVSIDVGFMHAAKQVYMQDEQFAGFLKSLIPIHQELEGMVANESLEGDFRIKVEYCGGHVTVSGEMIEHYSMSKACYSIDTDQSYMISVIKMAKRLRG